MTAPMQTFSIETEQALLGALMLDAKAADRIGVALEAAHFFREDHGRIYRAIRSLADAGRSADPMAVVSALEESGDLSAAGGMAYIVDLFSGATSAAGIARHAEIIADRAMLRALLAAANEISEAVTEAGKSVKDKVDFAQRRVMEISDRASLGARDPQRLGDLLPGYLADLQTRWERKGGGLSTGFPDLDARINGGMVEGQLIIVAGRPAMGKTTLALNIGEAVADSGTPVLVCSQEMPNVQLIDRALASIGRIPLAGINTGELSADHHDRMQAAVARMRSIPLYLDEQGALRIEDVRRKARQVKNRNGLGLLVIDYLQLMVGPGSDENRTQEITKISGALKALAKELRVPVIALSQLNRGLEQRPNKRPVMSDLRESGAIEQDADIILAAYRDEVYNDQSIYKGLAELLVLKNRQGAAGGFVPLAFHGTYTRFDSMFGDWPQAEKPEQSKRRRGFDD